MEQVKNHLYSMSQRQLIALVVGLVALIATLTLMIRLATAPSFDLLYSGLDPAAAGEVVNNLEQRGVQYEIRNDAIYVERAQRDNLRMILASEGLPATAAGGYEILDNLSGFGMTAQMFDAAYLRAKEGELARTITSSPQVLSARVHLSGLSQNVFRPDRKAKASVSISTTSGGINANQARAFRFLVSSAIEGLNPADVSIIDERDGLLNDAGATSALSTRREKTNELKSKVERLLDAHLGPGNSVVEVTLETQTDQQSIRQKVVDPKSRVAISTQISEVTEKSNSEGAAAVTVASNVPDASGLQGEGSSKSGSESRSTTNYEVSETITEIVKTPGEIKRMSVAVLVNEGALKGENLPETIETLRLLIGSAVGINFDRGDQITLQAQPFHQHSVNDTVTGANESMLPSFDLNRLLQLAAALIVSILLVFFVLRPLTKPQNLSLQNVGAALPNLDVGDESAQPIPPSIGQNTGTPTDRLRLMIGEKHDETVEILRSWLEEGQKSK